MRQNMKRAILVFMFIICNIIYGQSSFKLKVSGDIPQPLELSLSDLSKMPRKDAILKDKEGVSHTFNGVPITEILVKAGVPSGKAFHGSESFSKYVLVKCTDGYQVLYSLAELDPSIQEKNVIVADLMDGKPLLKEKGPLRVIAEGEKKPARSSFQTEEIIIGTVKTP